MKFSYPGSNEDSLKMIYSQAKHHFDQYQVWLKNSVEVGTTNIAVDHMKSCETLVSLMENITRRTHGGGYYMTFPCSLEKRLKSFKDALEIKD